MKLIYLFLTTIIATIILRATTKDINVNQENLIEQNCVTQNNLPPGRYFTIQPGLFKIANQMPKEYGRPKTLDDDYSPLGAYPIILNFALKNFVLNEESKIDTFKYDWNNDVIVCINSLDITVVDDWCELISSKDTLLAVWRLSGVEMKRNLQTKLKTNTKYFNAVKNWDKAVLDSICLNDDGVCSGSYYSIGRLTIKDGKLVDVKMIECNFIDTNWIK